MGAEESKPKNKFQDHIYGIGDFAPDKYERVALYSLLYNEIVNDIANYGFEDRRSLDVYVNDLIKDIMKEVQKIHADPTYVSSNPQLGKWAKDWMKRLIPLEDEPATPPLDAYGKPIKLKPEDDPKVKNEEYLKNFVKNLDVSINEAQRLTQLVYPDKTPGDNGMINIADTRLLLEAVRNRTKEAFSKINANQKYRYGFVDKEGKDLNSAVAKEWEWAKRELGQKKKNIRYNALKNIGKFALMAGLAVGTIASGGALIGGLTGASILGGAFVGNQVTASLFGFVGTIGGGLMTKSSAGMFIEGLGKGKSLRKGLFEWKHGLGEYMDKDGKRKSYKTIMFERRRADALKQYYLKGGDREKVPRKLRKYLPSDEELKDTTKEAKFFNYVNNQKGAFQKLERMLGHSVQDIPGSKGEHGTWSALSYIQKTLGKENVSVDELIDLAGRHIPDNKDKLAADKVTYYNTEIAKRLVKAFQLDVFENAYTSTTASDVESLINNATVKERLEDKGLARGEKIKVEDSVAFLRTEVSNNIDRSLDPDTAGKLGVGARRILDFSSGSILEGCKEIGGNLTEEQIRKARDAANIISRIDKKPKTGEAESWTEIESIITDDFPSGTRVYNYLKHMHETRVSASRHTEASVKADVEGRTDRANLEATASEGRFYRIVGSIARLDSKNLKLGASSSTLDEIKADIAGTGADALNATQVEYLENLLNSQVEAIEKRERQEAKETAMKAVQTGGFVGLKDEYLSKIEAITFDKISSNEATELMEKIKKQPAAVRTYLEWELRRKIEHECEHEIENNKEKYSSDPKALENVVNFLRATSACAYIGPGQKARLVSQAQEYLEKAIEASYKSVTSSFLTQTGKFDSTPYNNFLVSDYAGGGLGEFLATGSLQSKKIKDILVDMRNLGEVKDLFNGTDLTPDKDEAQIFSRIYFKGGVNGRRDNSDGLYKVLRKIKADTETPQAKKSWVSGDTSNIKTNYCDLLESIIDGADFGGLQPDEKYAVLIALKNKAIARFKQHVGDFVNLHGSNLQTYLMTNRAVYDNQVLAQWEPLFTKIQTQLNNIESANPELRGVKPITASTDKGRNNLEMAGYATERTL